jgi:RNA polymerase sigma-70 factor (ECF subfamily)
MKEHVTAVDINGWYRQYAEAVFRRCRRIVAEEALAMDLMQETFLRAHRYQHSYRGPSALSWLLTIADRASLTALKARPELTTPQQVQRFLEDEADPRSPPFEHHRLVATLLQRADERTRAIVMHRYFDELELQEIADRLDVNERTVRRKLELFLDGARRYAGLSENPLSPVGEQTGVRGRT